MNIYTSKSEEETKMIANDFANSLNGGDIVYLVGDLGAGKTTFTKFVAKALGIEDSVTSPTFTLMNIYQAKDFNLCHFDLYRLQDAEELYNVGFEEYLFSNDCVCLVEWPQILKGIINKTVKIVLIEKINDTERKFTIGDTNENIVY